MEREWNRGLNDQPAQRADQAVEHGRAAEARQLQRERNGPTDLRLKLDVVEGRG